MANVRRTLLYDLHRELGASFTQFGGYEAPLLYSSAVREHLAVRRACGLFDVSHMSRFLLRGSSAVPMLELLTTKNVVKHKVGKMKYTIFLNVNGGMLDDATLYRLSDSEFLLVCNAGSRDAMRRRLEVWGEVFAVESIVDITDESIMLALQGPLAVEVAERVLEYSLSDLGWFQFVQLPVAEHRLIVSRSGYTGEDGVEVVALPPVRYRWAKDLFTLFSKEVEAAGGLLCGLAARDSLRLEAGYTLHGYDTDASTTPLEAGLDFAVSLKKPFFIGRDALLRQREEGLKRKLTGIRMLEKGVPRRGARVKLAEGYTTRITSGVYSPLLRAGIGFAYLPPNASGIALVEVRTGVWRRAEIVKPPFYPKRSP